MNARLLAELSVLALLAGPAAAGAQTLTQRQTMAHEDPRLAEEAQTAGRICGTTIAADFDWQSFVAADKVDDMNGAFDNPPSNMCSVPLHVLQSMCQDAQAKQAVAARIKSYECAYQDGAAPSLSLDPAGRLLYRSSFEAYHKPPGNTPGDFVHDWLGRHL